MKIYIDDLKFLQFNEILMLRFKLYITTTTVLCETDYPIST